MWTAGLVLRLLPDLTGIISMSSTSAVRYQPLTDLSTLLWSEQDEV